MHSYFVRAPSDELYHFGIPGMKWGVRKIQYNKKYRPTNRMFDYKKYGGQGVDRINNRLNRGVSLRDARDIEKRKFKRARKKLRRAERIGALVGGGVGYLVGSHYAKLTNNKIRDSIGINDYINRGIPRQSESFGKKVAWLGKATGANWMYNQTVGRVPYKVLGTAGSAVGGLVGKHIGRKVYQYYSGYGRRLR